MREQQKFQGPQIAETGQLAENGSMRKSLRKQTLPPWAWIAIGAIGALILWVVLRESGAIIAPKAPELDF
jgi:hypothetical protein